MKLVIAGATGYLGVELVRQALAHSKIASIVALGRREATLPSGLESDGSLAKLTSIVCRDFDTYPESLRAEMVGADACIWTIAIPPGKLKSVTWEEACKISRDYAVTAIKTMPRLRGDGAAGKFKFVYVSGSAAERDPARKPLLLGDYCLMRGEAETLILASAQESNGAVEACIAKPGLIEDPNKTGILSNVGSIGARIAGLPKVGLREVSAALLDQVVNGFEKDTLHNEDLVRIGSGLLAAQKSS